MAASKNGKYLAVGFKSGAFFILQDNCTDLKAFKKRNDRQNSSISCISFSPNDDVLAVAG
jgi:WD40 repeat protein